MNWVSLLFFLCIGFFIGILLQYIETKKMIERIGKIKCKRCGYQGKPKGLAMLFRKFLIVCPECNSETWEKLID